MVVTVLPGMQSFAAETDGEGQAAASELQDENSQRLEEVTATEEDGSIYEIGETDGTVSEENAEEAVQEEVEEAEAEVAAAANGIAMFSARSVSTKVVNFNTKGNATTSYIDDQGRSGYTNGAYGADAAYLGVTSDGKIRFMLSGVTGTVSASEVELVDYDTVAGNVSYYTVSGGKLVHYISQNLNQAPTSSLNNGPAPSYLSEGGKYYSYDGHYFYTDYNVMISDYQAGANGSSAVNAGSPFYNYFQFLDMRSSTSYTGSQLDSILNTSMANAGISASSSKLAGTGSSFVENQNTYGVNALLSMGIAINESGWGTSWICQNKNNLFGLDAVDTSPGTSADTFESVQDCIRDFMKNWMAGGYLDSSDWRYEGACLGNKAEGMNLRYASDPYWGEKAAQHAWNLDAIGGSQDYLGLSGGGTDDTATDVPSTDTPSADTPATDTPSTDIPSADTPSTDEPSADTPPTDEPSADTPPADEPSVDTPSADTPAADTPSADEPSADTPSEDAPSADTPAADEPSADNSTDSSPSDESLPDDPSAESPAGGSDTDTPSTDAPSADTPTADDPSADTPVTDTPSTGGNDTSSEGGTSGEQPDNQTSDSTSGSETAAGTTNTDTSTTTSAAETKESLTDTGNRVTVRGSFSDGASVIVTAVDPNTDAYTKYVSADEVKGKTILGVYDITLTGTLDGQAELTFHVGSDYNGKNVIILHYTEDGNYEKYIATVENGQATIGVNGFSPYVIALDESGTGTVSPKTGDSGNMAVWAALLGLSAVIAAGALRKRSYR